nr:unnamed protein product [Callosobruchus chinensis]
MFLLKRASTKGLVKITNDPQSDNTYLLAGQNPMEILSHTTDRDYTILGMTPSDFIKKHGSPPFDFRELQAGLQSHNSTKKERGRNFTPEEKKLLLHLTGKYKNIIENKETDGVTWQEKENTWKQIETEFNSITNGLTRTAKQLKLKYESVKKELKKRYTEHKAYVLGTGGGEERAPPKPYCELEKELLAAISVAAEGLTSETDSDALYGITGISTEEVPSEEPVDEVVAEWVPSTPSLV